jgi:hypothetical protein
MQQRSVSCENNAAQQSVLLINAIGSLKPTAIWMAWNTYSHHRFLKSGFNQSDNDHGYQG